MIPDLKAINKTVLITGTTSGIGEKTAFLFAKEGWQLIVVNRNKDKSYSLKENIKKAYPNVVLNLHYADFSDLEQVKTVAHEITHKYTSIDVLINNAGIIDKQSTTLPNGLESHFSVNYMASVLLTNHLEPLLLKGSRVIMVSSVAHKYGRLNDEQKHKSWFPNYSNSKLAINLFVNYIAPVWKEEGICVNLIHPGVVGTTIFFNNSWSRKWVAPVVALFMKSTAKSANEYYYLATSKDVEGVFGRYFINNKAVEQGKNARDEKVQIALHEWTTMFLKSNHLL